MKIDPENLFTITKYAKLLTINSGKTHYPTQVYRMIKAGDLKTTKIGGVTFVVGAPPKPSAN